MHYSNKKKKWNENVAIVLKAAKECPIIEINDNDLNYLKKIALKIVSTKKKLKEAHRESDKRNVIGRAITGLLGERAVEKLLSKSFIEETTGRSRKYAHPDLDIIGLDCGVKSVNWSDCRKEHIGRCPLIEKRVKTNEIITVIMKSLTKTSHKVVILGLATKEILKEFQNDELVDDYNARKYKTGLSDLSKVIKFSNLKELKDLLSVKL